MALPSKEGVHHRQYVLSLTVAYSINISDIFRFISGLVFIVVGTFLLYPYSLIVYLVVAAILAATKQPIALAPYITWGFRLTWEEGVLRLNIDQESRWISHLHAVIIGSSLFYTGWCILPYRIQGRDIVRNH